MHGVRPWALVLKSRAWDFGTEFGISLWLPFRGVVALLILASIGFGALISAVVVLGPFFENRGLSRHRKPAAPLNPYAKRRD
jgi:hypothetical protein